jgi:hypothetical protein
MSPKVDDVIDLFRRSFGDQLVIYLSTPITGGPVKDMGYSKPEIMRRNAIGAWNEVQRIKKYYPNSYVINPCNFVFENWEVKDYEKLWEFVVKYCAKEVVFGLGWNLSEGCAREALWSVESGTPMLIWDNSMYRYMYNQQCTELLGKATYESEVIKECIEKIKVL